MSPFELIILIAIGICLLGLIIILVSMILEERKERKEEIKDNKLWKVYLKEAEEELIREQKKYLEKNPSALSDYLEPYIFYQDCLNFLGDNKNINNIVIQKLWELSNLKDKIKNAKYPSDLFKGE